MSFQKQKGNAFERKVATLLKNITGANWTRTPYSGAFLGRKNASRVDNLDDSQVAFLKGDIANPEGYKVIIECKSHADFSFSSMFQEGYAKLDKWINEAYVDSDKGKYIYWLIFNVTNKGSYLTVDLDQYPEMKSIPDTKISVDEFSYYYPNILFYYNSFLEKRYAILPFFEALRPEIWKILESRIKYA